MGTIHVYHKHTKHTRIPCPCPKQVVSQCSAEATALQVKLPIGTYSVQLLDGWQLSELLAGGVAQQVTAIVSGPKPLPLVVTADGTIEAIFQLQLMNGSGQLGAGRVRFEVLTADCVSKGLADCRLQSIDYGPMSDGCGGTLTSGTCPTGQQCNSAGACVSQPQTCATAGAQCGSGSDGCGATLDCGGCATGQTCSSTNQCACAPNTCASAGATCGSISAGCGNTLSCGTSPFRVIVFAAATIVLSLCALRAAPAV